MSTDLLVPYEGSRAVSTRRGNSKGNAVALVQEVVESHAQVFQTASMCERLVMHGATINGQRLPSVDWSSQYLTSGESECQRAVAASKQAREVLFSSAGSIVEAIDQLQGIINPAERDVIAPTQASVMVRTLVGAIAGKKSAEDQVKIDACVAMFNPTINAIAAGTELWGEVPGHPVLVSLGIMSMLYKTQTFCPAPSELAKAIRLARRQLQYQLDCMEKALDRLQRAEEILFDHAREEWAALYIARQSTGGAGFVGDRFHDERHAEWCAALEEIDNRRCDAIIREAIGKNGDATASRDVKEGDKVPRGVTPQLIPSELAERLPGLTECRYFLTPSQIAIVDDNKVVEVIEERIES